MMVVQIVTVLVNQAHLMNLVLMNPTMNHLIQIVVIPSTPMTVEKWLGI